MPMKASYKIALVLTVVACVTILLFHTSGNENAGADTPATVNEQGSAPQAEPVMLARRDRVDTPGGGESPRDTLTTPESQATHLVEPAQETSPFDRMQPRESPELVEPFTTEGITAYAIAPSDPTPAPGSTSRSAPASASEQASSASRQLDGDASPAATERAEVAPQGTPGGDLQQDYAVQSGDTFASIALKLYGSERYWIDIAQANPRIDPIRLRPGQVLRLPGPEQLAETADEDAPAAPGQPQDYMVRPGDTLSRIAKRFYGDVSRWRLIYNANRHKIGPDPDALRAGTEIEIPADPIGAR